MEKKNPNRSGRAAADQDRAFKRNETPQPAASEPDAQPDQQEPVSADPMQAVMLLLQMAAVADSGIANFQLIRKLCSCSEIEVGGEVEKALYRFIAEVSSTRVSLELGDISLAEVVERLPGFLAIIPIGGRSLEQDTKQNEEGISTEKSPNPRRGESPPAFPEFGLPQPPPILGIMAIPPTPPPPYGAPFHPANRRLIEQFLDLIRRIIAWLRAKGCPADWIRFYERLLAEARAALQAGSPDLYARLVRLFEFVMDAVRYYGFEEGTAFLRQAFGLISRIFTSRFFAFLGAIGLVLTVAQVSYAVGGEIAKIKINDKETVGTWWGNRYWDLIKGPCPQLLDALNLAILQWQQLMATGAPAAEQAAALAKVILLETEYIRRCLNPGTRERGQEEHYLANLQSQYSNLITTGTPPPAGPIPPAPAPARPPLEACNVVITLLRIDYAGNDIGSDWKFVVGAGTNSVTVPVTNLANGQSAILNPPLEVYRKSFSPCSGSDLIALSVNANQKHWYGDDEGSNAQFRRLTCPTDTDVKMGVWVIHESTFWGTTEGALLTFTFHIKGVCSAAVVP